MSRDNELGEAAHALQTDFGRAATAIARTHNRVFTLDPETASMLAVTAESGIALWGEVFPEFLPTGGGETWRGDYPLLESFSQWSDERNQRDLLQLVGVGGLEFQMLVSTQIPLHVLRRTYEESVRFGKHPGGLRDDLTNACHWARVLGWCCPLLEWSELGHAVLLVSENRAPMLRVFTRLMREAGRQSASVRLVNDRAVWQGPTGFL